MKKGSSIFIGITLIIFTFFLFSCKKKIPTFYISQQSKNYCYFKSGSYWIYRNDSTGSIDSIFTIQDPSSVITSRVGYQEEIIDVYLKGGFLTDYYMGHQCSSDQSINYNEGDDRVYLGILEPDMLQGLTFSFWPEQALNIEQADPCYCPYNNCNYFKTEMLDSYSYAGNIFHNVLHTNYRSGDTTGSNPYVFSYHYYFVKHIGLIRFIEKSVNHNIHRTFGLIRWKVNQ